jgi:eukaryotic-like serine/threonine-protein kinase
VQTGPSIGATDEERRAFYQARVATAGLIGGGLGGIFLLFRLLGGIAIGAADALDASIFYHFGGVFFLALMWFLCRGRRRSPRFVEVVDAGGIIGSCVMYSLMGTYIPEIGAPELVVTLALTHGLFARAIYVPSSARRTLAIGLLIGVIHIALVWWNWRDVPAYAIDLVHRAFPGEVMPDQHGLAVLRTVGATVWWVLTVASTTAASLVVYGLREEVASVRKLGQYELADKLGEGGMGVVYRARHAMLQRPTAVKLLPPDKVGEQTISRFEREVRLTAKLTHPNTITIYDYGRTLEGVFYYAMELLDDGATLQDVVEAGGPMSPARAVHVLKAAAGALTEAHEAGLIHRDIKPQNIMLCTRGGAQDVVKVLDFGLVKEVQDPDAVSLTGTNVIVGTPHFMAPEMLVHPDDVDGRSDIYALGAVAFFLLTGENLFEADTVVEVCGHHLHSTPRSSAEVADQEIPPELDELVARCLAKKPDDRPQTVRQLRHALCALTLPAWSDEDAAGWWGEHAGAITRAKELASTTDQRSVLRLAPRRGA